MMLKMEFKKIWNPKILLMIVVSGLLFGFFFLDYPLTCFPNGPTCEQQYQVMQDLAKKYGTEMDEREYEDALQSLKNKLGVTDETMDAEQMIDYVDESREYERTTASDLFDYELRYESLNDDLEENMYTPAEQIRVKDIIQNKKRDGILHYEITRNAMSYWRWVSVFILLSVMVLLAPNITRDALTGVQKLQYTSKCGRKILKTQFFATVLSGIGMAVLEVIIFAVLYAKLGTWQFWNYPINTFLSEDVYWFDSTYGQYLLFILMLMALFTGSAVGIAFSMSCFSRNYISLMLKIIPACYLLGALSNKCISYLFTFKNSLYGLTGVKGMEIYTGVIILLIGVAFSFITLKYKSRIRGNDAAV